MAVECGVRPRSPGGYNVTRSASKGFLRSKGRAVSFRRLYVALRGLLSLNLTPTLRPRRVHPNLQSCRIVGLDYSLACGHGKGLSRARSIHCRSRGTEKGMSSIGVTAVGRVGDWNKLRTVSRYWKHPGTIDEELLRGLKPYYPPFGASHGPAPCFLQAGEHSPILPWNVHRLRILFWNHRAEWSHADSSLRNLGG